MEIKVLHDEFAVRRRLAELGIDFSVLVDAIKAGCRARQGCTDLDPSMYPGSTMWAVTVRYLRLGLLPRGWTYSNTGNYSRTISKDGSLVVVVATGDEATGIIDSSPTTQSPKGPRTVEVVATNAGQLNLPFPWPDDIPQPSELEEIATWLLLVRFLGNKVKAELSRPVSFDEMLRVCGWHERLILPDIEAEPDATVELIPDESPDIDVPVRKRV